MNDVAPPIPANVRTVVILNPQAGHGRGGRRWSVIEPEARRLFPDLVIKPTTQAGDEGRLAREAVQEGAGLILAAGGDGTASHVVDGILQSSPQGTADRRPALGVLPVGTGSDWARGLGHPREPLEALKVLRAGKLRAVDLGRATFSPASGTAPRYWLNQSYIGIGARVVKRVNDGSGWLGSKAYTFAAIHETRRAEPVSVLLKGPGAPAGAYGLTNLIVANARYSGGGMLTSPRAEPSDGQFEFHAIGPISHGRLLRGLGKFRSGEYLDFPEVTSWRGTELQVEAPEGADLVEADGDIIGRLPVRYDLEPAALRVVI